MSGSALLDNPLPTAQPPGRAPKHVSEDGYARAIKISFGLHAGFIALVVLKSVVFPSQPKPYVPSLRVDMVALPDTLKKDLSNLPPSQSAKEIAEALKQAEQEARRVKPIKIPDPPAEKAEPDELVLKPKKTGEADKKRGERMMSALDRIKALSKIESETRAEAASARSGLVKGNKLSKGTSVSGDAREGEASYLDTLRGKLQENWALPVWLSRQNLDAQVRIFIDSRGRVRSYRFMKSSGNPQFDSAIKKTIEESAPFPPPPEDIASSLHVDGVLVGFPL